MVVDAARDWREAQCAYPHDSDKYDREGENCFYDNHVESCPCEAARQDLIAALNKLDMVDPR